jgi:IS30 family transposase
MSYEHLTLGERYVIYHLKLCNFSLREIGRRLGRHHSTISRELERNRPAISGMPYWHQGAHDRALERRKQPRHYRRLTSLPLTQYVERRLHAEWSPEIIAARLKLEHPGDPAMRVSAETVYRWVYRDAQQGGALFTFLQRRHKKRRKQRGYGAGRGLIPGRVGIEQRPALVALRRRFGDWEGDTVEGAKGSGYITTHVERKSRYLLAARLASKSAAETAQAVAAAFRRVPARLRKTLTLDNGKEFARFRDIEKHSGLRIYFADPYSACQRGTNENMNGRLRRYFPKGTDFRAVTDEALAKVVKKMNHRPRKCLGYRTPHEVFMQACRGALAM